MGGEHFRWLYIRDRKTPPTDSQNRAYEDVKPKLLEIYNEWKQSLRNLEDWDFTLQDTSEQFIYVKFIGKYNEKFEGISLPHVLGKGLWRVGWQHRHYSSYKDPVQALADKLIDLIIAVPTLCSYLQDDELDCVAEDLGYGDSRYESDEVLDYTACSAEDCGYCGRCDY
jgi:hypothetical protein